MNVDSVFCSTDSEEYATIAKQFGAEVPFLQSDEAASSTAMKQDILKDLYAKFEANAIEQPDLLVWLRPTFVFRNEQDVKKCIQLLIDNPSFTAARTVCESESRLYALEDDLLVPSFEDGGNP